MTSARSHAISWPDLITCSVIDYRDSMALLKFTRMVYRCVRLYLLLALHSMQSGSKYLAGVLEPLVGKTQFTVVANSNDFVKYIEGERIALDEVMVSFDVRALYTSLPLERTVEVVAARLKEDGYTVSSDAVNATTPYASSEDLPHVNVLCLPAEVLSSV